MVELTDKPGEPISNRWRMAAWGFAGLMLLLPLIAMQFTDEVNWDRSDFVVFAGLLLGVGLLFEITVKKTQNPAYRAGIGLTLFAAFLLVWVNGAVGIIGPESNDANLMYFAVLAIGVIGVVISRFRAEGMSRALYAMALAQATVAVVALTPAFGGPASQPLEVLILNSFWVVLFVAAALLFRKAASKERH